MKNIIGIFSLLFLLSCSSSDDTVDLDPIASAEFIPLKDFSELGRKTYFYAGIKAEGRKVSLLPDDTDSCQRDDFFAPVYNQEEQLVFFQYNRIGPRCEGGTSLILFTNNKLVNDGIFETTLYLVGSSFDMDDLIAKESNDDDDVVKSVSSIDNKRRERYDGKLEIGFQGGYLRVEDRMSHYSRPRATDKVYLYFKSKE